MINKTKDLKLEIVGLGYVGLPLALEFAKKRKVIGFDIDKKRIEELNSGIDKNLEFNKDELQNSNQLNFTNNQDDLKSANCYIITIPTPVDKFKKPDLTLLLKASETIGKIIKRSDLIIYESTVYPGCTEEVCVPVLEKFSKLKFNQDFFCGYSPERINPGDKEHTISNIKKVTSGSTPGIADLVDSLYKEIIIAGTHKAPSIKVAEAAKVIENTQRDLNIALMNELSKIFDKMGINTFDVLEAAGTKWNFLKFFPGLVGGHCIGVDPYYLTYKAIGMGYKPEVILAGRRVNDSMGAYVAKILVQKMIKAGKEIGKSKVLVMGSTFKEDVADIRNSKVVDVIEELKSYSVNVEVTDAYAEKEEMHEEYGIHLIDDIANDYDAVIVAVNHQKYMSLNEDYFKKITNGNGILMDIKGVFRGKIKDLEYWSL
jgi:UDP-N-acetyl-D-galactosamine dehydrogenase